MAPLRTWPTHDQPRERLRLVGAGALSDAELVALVLGSGQGTRTAVDVAHDVLAAYPSLGDLGSATVPELCQLSGIGPARACQLAAALELGRRGVGERPRRGQQIRSSAALYEHLRGQLAGQRRELFLALALDAKHCPVAQLRVAEGTLSAVDVHPREVFRELIRHAAAAAVMVHNHPSGDPEPSPDDVALTRRLRDVGSLVGIPLLDHVIVGDRGYVSLAERGLL